MEWLKKLKKPKVKIRTKKIQIPEGLWVKCEKCKEIVYKKDIVNNLNICPKCNHHYKLGARDWVLLLLDDGSFSEYDSGLTSVDPLKFKDSKKYKDRIKDSIKKLGIKEAVLCGEGKLNNSLVQLCVLDFGFLGGSMASAVGEKITRSIERALKKKSSLIIISCSGGARMQEGILSLMQMAKTSAALAKLSNAKIPYISILADPTTGGVTASFAMLGDINIAEPGALIGFAGPRVIEQTIKQKLPEGFQRAEFLLEHGMVDMVVMRKNLKSTLEKLLDFFKDE
ncbi:MAG TPA: acetyl-CoA carboxylase, carboxyltransferase subunit beta [Nitrospinota bacterium]|nr:acetyl-CoA carboxylase, carboxyltransferase subunit beta [Nitrospinota bacterium]